MKTSEWDGVRAGAKAPYPAVVAVDTARLNHHFVFEGPLKGSALATWVADVSQVRGGKKARRNGELVAQGKTQGRVGRTLVSEDDEPRRLSNGAARLTARTLPREALANDGRDALVCVLRRFAFGF